MDRKPILAFTAVVIFGYILVVTQEIHVRRVALLIITNALLCHLYGKECVDWDIFCNVVLLVMVLCTTTNKSKMAALVGIGSIAWMLNNFVIDCALLHALLVQGMGALALLEWKFC